MIRRIVRQLRLRTHQLYDARPGICWACRKPWPCETYRQAVSGGAE